MALKMPDALKTVRSKLERALAVADITAWPERTRLLPAHQPEAIGDVLVDALHHQLSHARVAYLFAESMGQDDRVTLGKAARASAKIRLLGDRDYVIDFNWTAWLKLTAEQRVALVDHELCHCAGRNEKGAWTMRHHDVEEFTAIVGRHGLWTPDLQAFAVPAAAQLELFRQTARPALAVEA
jgi:hypothetical protein